MTDTSIIEVNLAAIDNNLRVLRRVVGERVALCPVLKADGYGLGGVRMAQRLSACGLDMIAVYTPEQAAEMCAAAIDATILVLMPVDRLPPGGDVERSLRHGGVHLVVHDDRLLQRHIEMARDLDSVIPVHVEIDTGMSRGGCSLEAARPLLGRVAEEPGLRLAGVFTHFASADRDRDFTRVQFDRFSSVLAASRDLIPADCIIHAANTWAIFADARYHAAMVRVGLAWAGYGSELAARAGQDGYDPGGDMRRLMPAVTWTSRIIQVKSITAGTSVGYGRTWTARRATRLGLIPVGYADGYPMALSGGDGSSAPGTVAVIVTVDGREIRAFAPVVGAVNMDQITVDLTAIDTPDACLSERIMPGTPVELVSPDVDAPNHLTRLTMNVGRVPHDLLCGLNPRIRRSYVNEASLIEPLPASRSLVAG
jgi:alanine racemase